jgi:uncharacterized protein involved in type VI secretion and phage assembly
MPHKYLSHFDVKINGQNMSKEFYDNIEEISVDSALNMPSMFTIKLHDPELVWVDEANLDIGNAVEIGVELDANADSNTKTGKLIKGEITALEPLFSAEGFNYMCVRGYDKSHRLHLGRTTRTFLKKKDSDLASTIASECGLSVDADATTTVHEYIVQYNQTNMEFLLSRADRIGYGVFVQDGKLSFKKNSSFLSTSSVTLKYAEELISFEPRWSTSHQANQVTIKGWDSDNKQAISETNTSNKAVSQGGLEGAPGGIVSSKFQNANETLVSQGVSSLGEAKAFAEGTLNDIGLQFIQADGICYGNPGVQAGKMIKLEGVGRRFSGNYFVTSSLHVYNRDGYKTHFSISGRHPETLSRLIGADQGTGSSVSEVSGVVTGIVTNLKDPNKLGRVKVKFPWLADDVESDWMRVSSPMAGPERGFMYIPEVNDEVLVAFEHGNPNRPYLIGQLWNMKDKPPYSDSDNAITDKVEKRIIKTRAGHFLEFDDTKSSEKVTIKTKAGHQIVMDDKSGSENISITDKSGNKLVIDSSKKSVSFDVGGDFSVNSKGKIILNSTGNIEITAKAGNATVKGTKLSMEGTASSELKAPQVKVNGTAQAELTSGALVKLQGAIVKIN